MLMSILIFMHTIGGHYTFARVPDFGLWQTLGFERNMYDRVAHFSVGFYAFAAAELLLLRNSVRERWLVFAFPLFFIMALAAGYELFEWQFAVLGDPTAGIEVLGSQGDIWDAQKDILADTLGALTSLLFLPSGIEKICLKRNGQKEKSAKNGALHTKQKSKGNSSRK